VRYNFELFGLFNAVMVMNDRETGSIWSHIGGEAVDGRMKGASLEIIPMLQVSWEKWQELHPDTLVLSNDTPYQSSYSHTGMGGEGLGPEFIASVVYWDTRLPHNLVVLGVSAGETFRAYPVADVVNAGGILNDDIAGLPIVLVVNKDSALSVAYSSEVNGTTLHFQASEESGTTFVDRETGSTWNLEGLATDGPLTGASLTFVTSFLTEWYGWSAYHPDTEIYRPET
jgi:hypothetical protein